MNKSGMYSESGTLIGRGSFAQVYLKESEYGQFARKVIQVDDQTIGDMTIDVKVEIDLLSMFNNRYLVHYIGHKELIEYRVFLIDMEYCEGGSLKTLLIHLRETKNYLNYATVMRIFIDLIEGLISLHSQNITHRDLKADNILFRLSTEPVICDIGLGKITQAYALMNSIKGSPHYMAYEIFSGKYTNKCDVWSLGLLLCALIFNKPPTSEYTMLKPLVEYLSTFQVPDLPDYVDPRLKDVLLHVLVPEDQRYSVVELYNHPYIREYIENSENILQYFENYVMTAPPAGVNDSDESDDDSSDAPFPGETIEEEEEEVLDYTTIFNTYENQTLTNDYYHVNVQIYYNKNGFMQTKIDTGDVIEVSNYFLFLSNDVPEQFSNTKYVDILCNYKNHQWINDNLENITYWIPTIYRFEENSIYLPKDQLFQTFQVQLMNLYVIFLDFFGYKINSCLSGDYIITRKIKIFKDRYSKWIDDYKCLDVLELILKSFSDFKLSDLMESLYIRLINDLYYDGKIHDAFNSLIERISFTLENPALKAYAKSKLRYS